jgi:hypothetical protein
MTGLLSVLLALPCPFCGVQPEIQPWHGGGPRKHLISCHEETCRVSLSVTGATAQQAIKYWNERA